LQYCTGVGTAARSVDTQYCCFSLRFAISSLWSVLYRRCTAARSVNAQYCCFS